MSSDRWKVWAALICFLGFTPTVHAAAPTGKELLAWCTAKDRSEESAGCMAYVSGFVHGFKVGRSEELKGVVCLPPDLTEEHLSSICSSHRNSGLLNSRKRGEC